MNGPGSSDDSASDPYGTSGTYRRSLRGGAAGGAAGRSTPPPGNGAGRASVGRAGAGDHGAGSTGYGGNSGSGRAGVGRASVGRASVGRGSDPYGDSYSSGSHGADGYGVGRHSADPYSGSGATGRASVGRASVRPAGPGGAGGPGGPGGPYDPNYPGYADDDGYPGNPPRGSRAASRRAAALAGEGGGKKAKRRRRLLAGAAALLMLTGFAVLGGTYFFMSVPLPGDLPSPQVTTIYYSDGKTVMARIGTENRTRVPIDKIPDNVQHAVVAAEDRTFYTNSGVSVTGIARAAWSNVAGGESRQGGSTITQQYAKIASDANSPGKRTYSQKAKEAVIAMKLDREFSKKQILDYYLNTIYFGRGAYGIQAASLAYFGKAVVHLSSEEAAVLASCIKDPSYFDPAVNADAAKERWKYVLDQMSVMNWYDRGKIASAVYPKTIKPSANGPNQGLDAPTGLVVAQVKRELADRGISEQQLTSAGFRIVTTIDKRMEDAAIKSSREVLAENPKNLQDALVSVEPGTGRVKAYYGGENGVGFDYVMGYDGSGQPRGHQPGSSFKVYALATAIENNISVKSYWDSSTPRKFPDRATDNPVTNSDGSTCGKNCPLWKSTVMSLNTTYYALTSKVGKEAVIKTARDAGIRTMMTDGSATGEAKVIDLTTTPPDEAAKLFGNEVGFGQYPVTVLDHANGFATIANNGTYTEAHFVEQVYSGEKMVFRAKPAQRPVFSADTAADMDWVLKQVVGNNALNDGRDAGAKTGTWQYKDTGENSQAWMCGYTPQLATAVWMGRKTNDGPIVNSYGANIYGSMLPGQIWKKFMDRSLEGKPEKDFPPAKFTGSTALGDASAPPPSPTPSPKQPSVPPSLPPSPSPSRSTGGLPGAGGDGP